MRTCLASATSISNYRLTSWGSGSNSLDFVIPPVTALTTFFGSSVKISTSLSNDLSGGPAAAKGKDVAFVFVNA